MAETRETLDPTDPNLQQATGRLQRIEWIWAALFLGMAILTWFTLGQSFPLNPIPWLITALIMTVSTQPAALAMVAVIWVLSLISIMPGFALVFGPDPISEVFSGGTIEVIGRAAIRVILAITAWNQFMLYRMLYGTKGASGLPENAADIPEMIPNRTRWYALGSLATGLVGVLAGLVSLLPALNQSSLLLVQSAYNFSLLAIGAGLGVSFSPTKHRRIALIGLLAGAVAFIAAMAAGSLLLN